MQSNADSEESHLWTMDLSTVEEWWRCWQSLSMRLVM